MWKFYYFGKNETKPAFTKNSQSYFWRSLQQLEVYYTEVEQIRAYEMDKEKKYITTAFTNLNANVETMLVQPTNITEFCYFETTTNI